jgi:hypothetical protein
MRYFTLPLPRRRCIAAAILALAVPAALRAQAIGIGVGFGVGTRTGLSISVGAQVTDEVQLVCKAGGFPFVPSSTSCGTHLYLFDNPDRFVVAEVGMLFATPSYRAMGPHEDVRWVFVQGGVGVRDHEIPDQDDDALPDYPRWVNASYSGGLSLVVARIGRTVTPTAETLEIGERHVRPALWPLFFADAQVDLYLPGRNCSKCGGNTTQDRSE